MPRLGKFTPATIWRAFFVFSLGVACARGASPPAQPPELAQVGLPDAAETREILEQFRHSGIAGQYFLQFELHALPRRGAETVFHGRMWGGRNADGALSRVELTDSANRTHRLLVQNGEHAAVWRFAGARVEQLGVAALFEPVIPGVEITAFDLQMPFLYWPDAKVQRIARVLGRPAHAILFTPPAAFAAQHPEIAAVRVYLDTQFNALVQVDVIGAKNTVTKTTALVGLKKVGEQWIPKALDVRNELTRDKTRFLVAGAALNLDLAPAVFEPASLAEDVRAPAADRIVPVEP
ncbi:MAG TPA: hypothetical protein VHD62_01250 [Opitutaceae bacterium]|nr:hypothetical protein [Opitutaceae bacterium]